MSINKILSSYDHSNLTIGVLGSHSALDVCRGAKDFGFNTLVIAQKGREKTYNRYYKSKGQTGCVDHCIVLSKFSDVLKSSVQKQLLAQNTIFVPHRSFEVYLNSNYQAIETKFKLPMFGNRYLLKIEERNLDGNQYDLMKFAGIRFPKVFSDPKHIDRLCLVKVLEKKTGFERAFFLTNSYKDFKTKSAQKIKAGIFTAKQLKEAVIEEYVVGVHVNFNFFYSPLYKRLELMGTDTRRQTNYEGIVRTPAYEQPEILSNLDTTFQEAGHTAVTVLESMLEPAFKLGERFVKASKKLFPPGVIGPFALQSIITPGSPKEIIVIDISPRMPGSPGISATPYSHYLHGKSLPVGHRLAMEVINAVKSNKLDSITT